MTGAKIAILGLGRSGVSAAMAALSEGAQPSVFDERAIDTPQKEDAAAELRALGVDVQAAWDGWFSSRDFDLVVTSPGVPMRNSKLQAAVEEGMEVLSEVEFAFRISKAPIIAVTGTNGKSTTTAMTWLCLKAAGVDAVLCGNIYGSGYPEIPLTQAAMSSSPDQILVAEISSFQLEFVKEFRPISAAITNIDEDHLDRYKSFEEYAEMKRRIFLNMGEGCAAIWNAGDESTKPPANEGLKVLAFGSDAGTGLSALETESSLEVFGTAILKRDLPWTEAHNTRNAMCAALLAVGALESRGTIGGPPPNPNNVKPILEGLKSFHALSHRMERLGEKGGVRVINNSMCTNPGALIASSRSVEGPQRLLVGGKNKGMRFESVGTYLETAPHTVYLFGKDADAINAQLGSRWKVYPTMADAFEAATKDARAGETIMLAPGVASTDQFQDFQDRGEAFKRLAAKWLGE